MPSQIPFSPAPTEGIHEPTLSTIVWNWNLVPGATGYKWNKTNNYATAVDMAATNSKRETGLKCDSNYIRYAWAYSNCGNSTSVLLTQSTVPCASCTSITINHVAGSVAPVSKTVTYGTVINIPGGASRCWITSNLGSDHQATAVNDATEASAGWYWQFNLKQGYKQNGSVATPAWTITSINESSDWLSTNDPCNLELGAAWRIPTYTEWNIVDLTGGWGTWNGPWDSGLKMHAAGYINTNNGLLLSRGSSGYYLPIHLISHFFKPRQVSRINWF
jgi:hypothetical protein